MSQFFSKKLYVKFSRTRSCDPERQVASPRCRDLAVRNNSALGWHNIPVCSRYTPCRWVFRLMSPERLMFWFQHFRYWGDLKQVYREDNGDMWNNGGDWTTSGRRCVTAEQDHDMISSSRTKIGGKQSCQSVSPSWHDFETAHESVMWHVPAQRKRRNR